MALKILFTYFLVFVLCTVFFSFRLLEVPRGITTDEAAFGYNASLLSETLRDENGRFLPVFVLSLDSRDWRQPVTQYFQTFYFSLFGKSLFNLKFTSVLVISISGLLIFWLGRQIRNIAFGFSALLLFITTPIVMIHSHLALDNIMPIPFILIWILGLVLFEKKKLARFLIISAVSLGISFYAHKSMRSAASVWTILSIFYLIIQIKKYRIISLKNYSSVLLFAGAVLPFYLISPVLDYKYAGAVFGGQELKINSIYDFIYFYISSFDPSFLFIKGDLILHHSTGIHGMFLLSVLPVFIFGIYKSITSGDKLLKFLVICFFAGPVLMGFVGSIHRASRIIFLVPIFSLICAYGVLCLLKYKSKIYKILMTLYIIVIAANFYDFINYYWFRYAEDTYHIFYSPAGIEAYRKLGAAAKKEKLTPLISDSLLSIRGNEGTIEDFSRSLFFVRPEGFDERLQIPNGSILLSTNPNLKSGEKLFTDVKNYYLYLKRN